MSFAFIPPRVFIPLDGTSKKRRVLIAGAQEHYNQTLATFFFSLTKSIHFKNKNFIIRFRPSRTSIFALCRPDPMAASANHFTLSYLGANNFRPSVFHRSNSVLLPASRKVVEVHAERRERLPAIRAWPALSGANHGRVFEPCLTPCFNRPLGFAINSRIKRSPFPCFADKASA